MLDLGCLIIPKTFPLFVSASPVPLLHSYEWEFKALQVQMKKEENKTKMMEEMIKGLNSDKLKLEQEVAHLKELLVQKEKQAKTGKKAAGHQLQSVKNMNKRILLNVCF